MDDLRKRVENLEREDRMLKRGGLAALVIVASVMLMGQSPRPEVSEEIRTRRLAILDESGKIRAILSGSKAAALSLRDETSSTRAILRVDRVGAILELVDEAGKARAVLGTAMDHSFLRLDDENGTPRAALRALKDGSTLRLYDENGKSRALLEAAKTGPVLALADDTQTTRAILQTDKNGPSLRLGDSRGYEAQLGSNLLETLRTGENTRRSAASLVMLDKDKTVIWQAP